MPGVCRRKLFLPGSRKYEFRILAYLFCRERVAAPPVFVIAERRSEVGRFASLEFPPAFPIREEHGMVAGNGNILTAHPINLVPQAIRAAPVVVIPRNHHGTTGEACAEVALFADARSFRDVNIANAITACEIRYVLAVREDEKFPVWVRLPLVTLDRSLQPLAPVARQAQASRETG